MLSNVQVKYVQCLTFGPAYIPEEDVIFLCPLEMPQKATSVFEILRLIGLRPKIFEVNVKSNLHYAKYVLTYTYARPRSGLKQLKI